MESTVDVAIVGAGPYGLSLAAHLQARGVEFRIFGIPMQMWRENMPAGMFLKSEGFASNLDDPNSDLTLGGYCRRKKLDYQDLGLPVPLDTFSSYGLAFQGEFVGQLEELRVNSIERIGARFKLSLSNGEIFFAHKVVVATGITNFEYLPPLLRGDFEGLVTHSSQHRDLSKFRGREVTVIGAGASAMDLAGLLHEAGASVQLCARASQIHFHNPPGPRSLVDRLRAPMTGLGPGWRSLMCTRAPLLFHLAPERFRLFVVQRHLGPAPGWFTKDKVLGKVPLNVGQELRSVQIQQGRVHLRFSSQDGSERGSVADHVIAATGYRVDLSRLPFLPAELRSAIRTGGGSPILDSSFESSVPDLYFLGNAAAVSFGPLLRFVYGTAFAVHRLSHHLVTFRPGVRVLGRSSPNPV